jgi:hypothetical protein
MGDLSPVFQSSDELQLQGYVLDESALRNINQTAQKAVLDSAGTKTVSSAYKLHQSKNEIAFEGLEFLVEHLRRSPEHIQSLNIRHSAGESTGINVSFGSDGIVKISGYSENLSFRFAFEEVKESTLSVKEEYMWLLRYWALAGRTKRIMTLLSAAAYFFLSVCLFVLMFGYAYAKKVGVDVDPKLIPQGNERFKQLADAIKSTDINTKLDALLASQFTGFQNVTDFLADSRRAIVVVVTFLIALNFVLIVRKVLERLYPLSYFSFGRNERELQRLRTKRQFWGVTIFAALPVNLLAGILVSVLMGR